MNVFKKIKEAKRKALDYKDQRQEKRAVRSAEEMKDLQKRRVMAERREKVFSAEDKEKERYNSAQRKMRKRTPSYRIVNALVDKAKEHRANNPPQMGRLPSGDFIGKTGGMSLHKVKPKKKRGGRSITIKY